MKREFAFSNNDYRRFHERKKYPAEIVFHHANRLYAGSLKMSALVVPILKHTALINFRQKILLPLVSLFPLARKMSDVGGAFNG